jgi:hypothetical protein
MLPSPKQIIAVIIIIIAVMMMSSSWVPPYDRSMAALEASSPESAVSCLLYINKKMSVQLVFIQDSTFVSYLLPCTIFSSQP